MRDRDFIVTGCLLALMGLGGLDHAYGADVWSGVNMVYVLTAVVWMALFGALACEFLDHLANNVYEDVQAGHLALCFIGSVVAYIMSMLYFGFAKQF